MSKYLKKKNEDKRTILERFLARHPRSSKAKACKSTSNEAPFLKSQAKVALMHFLPGHKFTHFIEKMDMNEWNLSCTSFIHN